MEERQKVLKFSNMFRLNNTIENSNKIYDNYQKITEQFMNTVIKHCKYKFVMNPFDFQRLCYPILIEDKERSDAEGWTITEILGYTKPEIMYSCTLCSDFDMLSLIKDIKIENDLQIELLQKLTQQDNGSENYTIYLYYDKYINLRDKHKEDKSYIYQHELYNIFTHKTPKPISRQQVKKSGYKILTNIRK